MPHSLAREDRRRQRRLLALFACLYALVLLASPLLHHDFDCHLKSAQHCVACLAQPQGSEVQASLAALGVELAWSGDVGPLAVQGSALLLPSRSAGRAPPSAS
ncbi:MAG: hypothetical protein AB7O37_00060 [Vicinamibacteria bacterium]